MSSAISPVSYSPGYAVAGGYASSSSAYLEHTRSTSLTAYAESSSSVAAAGHDTFGDALSDTQKLAVLLLILQTLFGETEGADSEKLLGLLGVLGVLAEGSGAGAGGTSSAFSSSFSSSSFLSVSQSSSTTLAVSEESVAFFAAAAYAPAPFRGDGGYSALA